MLVAHNFVGDSRVNKTFYVVRQYGQEAILLRYPPKLDLKPNNLKVKIKATFRTVSIQISTMRLMEKMLPKSLFEIVKRSRNTHHAKRIEKISSSLLDQLHKFEPTIIYAHDADTLTAAILYKRQVGCAVIYDAHEYLRGLSRPDPGWQPAMLLAESGISQVDAVITVSDQIAELLKVDYQLVDIPHVVLNAPSREVGSPKTGFKTFREVLGLQENIPFHVYVGSANDTRGLSTMVKALEHVGGHHVGFVINNLHFRKKLESLAKRLGVSDRVHFSEYVDGSLVTAYIADATSGISPVLRSPNHELSCFTKFYEYAQAQIPIITSNVTVMATTVIENNIGEVFPANDEIKLAGCMKSIAKNRELYRNSLTTDLLEKWSWESQVPILLTVLDDLTLGFPKYLNKD